MNKILIPRRIEERKQHQIEIELQKIQRYIDDEEILNLYLINSPLDKFPDNLTTIKGHLFLNGSKIQDLNKLEHVKGNIYLYHTKIVDINQLPENLYVEGRVEMVIRERHFDEKHVRYEAWHFYKMGGKIERIKTDSGLLYVELPSGELKRWG